MSSVADCRLLAERNGEVYGVLCEENASSAVEERPQPWLRPCSPVILYRPSMKTRVMS